MNVLYLRQPCIVVERYEISVDGHVLEASLHSTKSPDDVHNREVLLCNVFCLLFNTIDPFDAIRRRILSTIKEVSFFYFYCNTVKPSSVTYPEIWRCEQISLRRYRISRGDAASLSGDAVVSHWRCIISFRDAHPRHSHPHLQ